MARATWPELSVTHPAPSPVRSPVDRRYAWTAQISRALPQTRGGLVTRLPCRMELLESRHYFRNRIEGGLDQYHCTGTGNPVWFWIGSLGRGGRAAPAKEVVQDQGDARGAGQQAAGWTRTRWKIRLISWGSMSPVSDIKLIRTDTTLDLSQKAEKGILHRISLLQLIYPKSGCKLRKPYGITPDDLHTKRILR